MHNAFCERQASCSWMLKENTRDKCTHASGGCDWNTLNLGTGRSVSLYLVHIRPILGSRTMSTGGIPGFCKQNKHIYARKCTLHTVSTVNPSMSLSPELPQHNHSSFLTSLVFKRVVSHESLAPVKLFDVLCQVFTTRVCYIHWARQHTGRFLRRNGSFRSPARWSAVHRSGTVCANPFSTLGQ